MQLVVSVYGISSQGDIMDIEKLDEFHMKFESECCSFPNSRFLGHLMDVDINGKNAHDEITCQISLVTRNLFKLDSELLEAYKNPDRYDVTSRFHPYFTELVTNITVNDYKDTALYNFFENKNCVPQS